MNWIDFSSFKNGKSFVMSSFASNKSAREISAAILRWNKLIALKYYAK